MKILTGSSSIENPLIYLERRLNHRMTECVSNEAQLAPGPLEAELLSSIGAARGPAFNVAVMKLYCVSLGDTGAVANKFHESDTNQDGNKQREGS